MYQSNDRFGLKVLGLLAYLCFLRLLSASAPSLLQPPGMEKRWRGVGEALERL